MERWKGKLWRRCGADNRQSVSRRARGTAPACRPAAPAPAFACGCRRTRSGNDVAADWVAEPPKYSSALSTLRMYQLGARTF